LSGYPFNADPLSISFTKNPSSLQGINNNINFHKITNRIV
jgi:hypothetical protein